MFATSEFANLQDLSSVNPGAVLNTQAGIFDLLNPFIPPYVGVSKNRG